TRIKTRGGEGRANFADIRSGRGFRRDRFRAKSALPSALRRQNDAKYNALVLTHLSRSTDVSATIGRDHVVDLVVGHRRPAYVHFIFVLVSNHATWVGLQSNQIAA